jgi:hypothetical protein
VQHADNAEVGVPEFVGKGLQGFGGTAHEDGVDLGIAVLHQAVEVFGQGEDEVKRALTPFVLTPFLLFLPFLLPEGLVHNSNQLTSGCVEFSVRLCF